MDTTCRADYDPDTQLRVGGHTGLTTRNGATVMSGVCLLSVLHHRVIVLLLTYF